MKDYSKSKAKKRDKSHIPFRLNLIFFIVFILFAALIAQLAYLQLIYGSKFESLVNSTNKTVVSTAVPRGEILDSQGRVLAGNQASSAVTYTKGANVLTSEEVKTAERLSDFISVDDSSLTPRDEIDYYLANEKNLKAVQAKLPHSAKYSSDNQPLSSETIYNNTVAYMMKHLPNLDSHQKQVAMIFSLMNSAQRMATVYIKTSDVSEEQIAEISEHLTEMPGVNIGTYWNRSYPNGDSMENLIGTVSTEKQGLPADELSTLLAEGYSRNDRVGTSYLEKEYEPALQGTKGETQVDISNNNQIVKTKTLYKGQAGSNLQLTINMDYQNKVQSKLKSIYEQVCGPYSQGAYAVAMNPNTGQILAMAGVSKDSDGKVVANPLGAINQTFTMGSVVKGAMVMGALMDHVITPTNNTQSDDPIYLPSTPVKKSVYPIGTFSSLNAVTALEVSSNIYMMRLALKEAHADYVPHKYISMDPDIFEKLRGYFSDFGLGPKTGIDLPGEVSAYLGPTHTSSGALATGSALDLSYGNFDAYTVIQLAQYISTIANNGRRMRPYIVNAIEKANPNGSNTVVQSVTQPEVESTVTAPQSYFDLVKKGMWEVVHGTNAWTTAKPLASINPGMAAKTGTAQSFTHTDPNNPNSKLVETTTESLVGFAPANDPQIAIALVFPNLNTSKSTCNLEMAEEMIKDYYSMHNIGSNNNNNSSSSSSSSSSTANSSSNQ